MWCRVTQRSVWHDVCVVQLERRRALSKVEVSFDLVDDSGRIRVVPEKADMTGLGVLSEEGDWGHPLWSFGGASTISGSTGRRRFSESAVPVGAAVFVLGSARLQGASAVREIRRKLRRGWAGAHGGCSPLLPRVPAPQRQRRERRPICGELRSQSAWSWSWSQRCTYFRSTTH